MKEINRIKLSGWANYPVVEASFFTVNSIRDIPQYLIDNHRVIARGNGKSYGDASLGEAVISTLNLRRVLAFDQVAGIVECESGVLLSDLLPTIVPAGWFYHVTPGIKHITVGGAIASDVHGKNHPTKGCFSNWLISFDLMRADGQIVTCSKTENADLFWQTCGGMGWTGIILSAKFQLMRIANTAVHQKTVQCQNIDETFDALEANRNLPYAAGWIDTTSKTGRGSVHFADHVSAPAGSLAWEEKKVKNIPFFAPSGLLNPMSIRIHNAFYFNKNHSAEKVVSLDEYFYPLDAMTNWNRLYGRRGFVQYQFCIPENVGREGIRNVMQAIQKSTETPFLSVLKRHGARAPEAIHSFPENGYSLALDFPRTNGIFSLVKKLDEMVWGYGGKIYLTKDACSAPKMGRINPETFGETKFWSSLRSRISE